MPDLDIEVPEGGTTREVVARTVRPLIGTLMDLDLTGVTDCQILDTIIYSVFPSFRS